MPSPSTYGRYRSVLELALTPEIRIMELTQRHISLALQELLIQFDACNRN